MKARIGAWGGVQSASALRTRHAIAALGHGRPNGSLATDTMMTSTAVRVSGPSRRVSSTMSYALIAQSRAASSAFRTASTSQARGIQTSDSAHSVVSCAHIQPQRRPSTPNDIPPTPALTDARTISSTTFPVSPSVPQTPTSQRSSYSRSWGASDADRAEIRVASTREVYAYEAELNTSSPPASPALIAGIPSPIRESQSPLERPEWLEEVLEERRADEEWMHYVRAQLGALFPDFVDSPADIGSDADQPQHQRQANTGDEAASVSSPHVGEVASPMTIGPDNWANAEQAGRTVINSIPSVRSEINELRDEIERLRGVVGGLASDLSAVPAGIQWKDAEAVVHLAQPGQPESRSMAASGPDVGDEEDRVAVEGLLVGEDEQDKYELRMAMESDFTSVGMPKAVDVLKAVDTASTQVCIDTVPLASSCSRMTAARLARADI